MANDDLVITFVPALVDLLRLAEERKGSSLTRAEAMAVRDQAACIALPRVEADRFLAARGYDDIDPDRCWDEWQRVTGRHA